MNQPDFKEADQYMREVYGLSIEEAGLTADEFFDRFGDESPAEAVESFATKYDLTPISL